MNATSANVALVAAALASSDTAPEEIKYRTLTDTEEERALDAVRVLHSIFAGADRGKSKTSLPNWGQCGLEQVESVLDRTFSGLKRKASADAARVIAKAKQGILSDIETARETEALAYAEWTTLSSSLQARFPYKAPKTVKVPVSDTLRHFPKGWTVAQAAKVLTDVGGFKLMTPVVANPSGKGRPVSDTNNTYIEADLVPASTNEGGSTLPHGNGERVELSSGQAIAAAK